MTKVYLSGAISNAPEYGEEWRESVKEQVSDYVEPCDPLDFHDFEPEEEITVSDDELVRQDKLEIADSDVVLVNWQSNVPKAGTPMEIMYAYNLGVPVVVWHSDCVREEVSPWVRHHASFMFERLEDAVEMVETHGN